MVTLLLVGTIAIAGVLSLSAALVAGWLCLRAAIRVLAS